MPDPENPGWFVRPAVPVGQFIDLFGEMRVKVDAPDRARLRVMVDDRHRNLNDTAHGGFLLGLIDQAYFICPTVLGVANAMGGVTIDSSTQFLAPVLVGRPVDTVVEILRETGRMLFLRGLIEQGDVRAAAFSGTIRKTSVAAPRA